MDPALLSHQLVQGYAKIDGQWEQPLYRMTSDNHVYYAPSATAMDTPKYLYIQPTGDHLSDPIYIATMSVSTWTAGETYESYYSSGGMPLWKISNGPGQLTVLTTHQQAEYQWLNGIITRQEYDEVLSKPHQVATIAILVGPGYFDGTHFHMGSPNTYLQVVFSDKPPGESNLDLD